MADPTLTIIMPTYQNTDVMIRCLGSLLHFTEFPYHIILVNNDPSAEAKATIDGIIEALETDCVEALHMHHNAGWMGAINAGLKLVYTPYVCFANDDLIFIRGQMDFWSKMTKVLDVDQRVGAIGPVSNFVMGLQHFHHMNLPNVHSVGLLIGFCVLLRTNAIKAIGGLDESLAGGDDLDMSIRLRDAGWYLAVMRKSYVHHVGSVTGNRLFKGYWNSMSQVENTDNAIIRKHGVRKWYDTQTLSCPDIAADEDTKVLWTNDSWIDIQRPEDGKGIDLGSGARSNGSSWGLDIAKPGSKGVGGRKFEPSVNDIVADAINIPVVDSSLDYLTTSHLIEHIVCLGNALDEWSRVLKPGAILILTCPDHDKMESMVVDSSHVHAFNHSSLKRLFTDRNDFRLLTEPIELQHSSMGIVVEKVSEGI